MEHSGHRRGSRLLRRGVSLLISGCLTVAIFFPVASRLDLFPANIVYAGLFFKFHQMALLPVSVLLPYLFSFLFFYWTCRGCSALWCRIAAGSGRPAGVEKPSGKRKGVVRRSVGFLARGAVLLATVLALLSAGWAGYNHASTGEAGTFNRVCSQCHPARRALSRIRSNQAWQLKIERMREKAPDRISPEEGHAAHAYLLSVRSWTDRQLFEIKCGVCHRDPLRHGARSRDEWRRIVTRAARFNPFFLSPMHVESILAYLDTTDRVLPAPGGVEAPEKRAQALFETRCVQCHTLDVVLLPGLDGADWESILRRMDGKAPGLVKGADSTVMAPWIRSMREDPDRFRHAVPHHTRELFRGRL